MSSPFPDDGRGVYHRFFRLGNYPFVTGTRPPNRGMTLSWHYCRGGGRCAQKPGGSEGPFLWGGDAVVMGTREEGVRPGRGTAGKIGDILLQV
jgi:hypothetical protein